MTVTTRPVPDHTTEQRPTSHCVPTRVDALADTDGHVLTVATHQDCPARAAYLTTDHTGDKGAVHCCLDPETMLIGRRAGWHPAVIIAASMVLRWPFHIYHGAWTSLPWAALWGGSYVAAFLYLRRLAPLIVFHAGSDAYIDMQSAYGDTGATLVLLVGAALVVFLALRITPDRRRRLNPTADTGDPKVARYLLFRDDWKNTAILAAAILAVIAGAIGLAPDAATRVLIGALIALTLGVGGRVLWASWVASNVIVHRDRAGAITGVIRWHTTYTGDTSIDTITTGASTTSKPSAPSPASTATPSSSPPPRPAGPDSPPPAGPTPTPATPSVASGSSPAWIGGCSVVPGPGVPELGRVVGVVAHIDLEAVEDHESGTNRGEAPHRRAVVDSGSDLAKTGTHRSAGEAASSTVRSRMNRSSRTPSTSTSPVTTKSAPSAPPARRGCPAPSAEHLQLTRTPAGAAGPVPQHC